jgi:predicted Fe-Mo cluster-binding NifX family protein
MKIAVTALGPGLDDRVDTHFGRAMHFVVADTETGWFEPIDNGGNRNAMHGAGMASAELISEAGVEAVITGHLGPNAFVALGAAGIPGYDGSGMSVREAIEAFKAGTLRSLDEAGEAHAG